MNDKDNFVFNPPPGWPKPPKNWRPPAGWEPDPAWGPVPEGWPLWLPIDGSSACPRSPAGESLSPEPPPLAPSGHHGTDTTARIAELESENASLRAQLDRLSTSADELVALDDDRVLQDVGIYRYHHPLENAALYKERLAALSGRIASLVKAGQAIEASTTFTYDNSLAKGRRMTADLGKLMLRAYNAEADNSIRTLKLGNVVTAKRRLDASRDAIAKLGRMMEMHISDAFHALRLEEIELTADWLVKKQEEREAAKEERERLREERRVEKELAEQRERLDKEREHVQNAIAALSESGRSNDDLEAKLVAIDDAIANNDYRAANVRAGYVYVISNRGAFGDGVVKIGLTRRLEPMERILELGDASVPFRFDVHALFFSEDAVSLESELHNHFASRAVNKVNARKEFFFSTSAEVREVLVEKVGSLLEFTEHADATEYLQSVKYWPDSFVHPGPRRPPADHRGTPAQTPSAAVDDRSD